MRVLRDLVPSLFPSPICDKADASLYIFIIYIICLGYYNKMPIECGVGKWQVLFLTDLEAGSPRCQQNWLLVKALFGTADCKLLAVSLPAERYKGSLLALLKDINHFKRQHSWRFHLNDIITSQRLYLLMPSYWT